MLGSLAALAIGAGIYIATRGKKGTSSVLSTLTKPHTETPNVALKPAAAPPVNPSKPSQSREVSGREAFEMINKDHKAGVCNRYAFIPKNNKEQCVVIDDIETNGRITKYRQVFNLKDLKYSTSLNEIIETKPISQKLFYRSLFDRNIGSYSSTAQNGTNVTIENILDSNKRLRRTTKISSKDGLWGYEKSQYSNNNGEKCITEVIYSHEKCYCKGTSENKLLHLDENFEEQKQLAFENFKK